MFGFRKYVTEGSEPKNTNLRFDVQSEGGGVARRVIDQNGEVICACDGTLSRVAACYKLFGGLMRKHMGPFGNDSPQPPHDAVEGEVEVPAVFVLGRCSRLGMEKATRKIKR